MYPGLPSRLEREIKQLYLERVLKVIDHFFMLVDMILTIRATRSDSPSSRSGLKTLPGEKIW